MRTRRTRKLFTIGLLLSLLMLAACGHAVTVQQKVRLGPSTTARSTGTTVPVQDPARKDTREIEQTIHDLDVPTTTLPRTS